MFVHDARVCIYELETAVLQCQFSAGPTALVRGCADFAFESRRFTYCII